MPTSTRSLLNRAMLVATTLAVLPCLGNAQWDPNQLYTLHNQQKGVNLPLTVIDGGADNNELRFAARDPKNTGQYFKITPTTTGFYRISSVLRGANLPIDIINGGPKNNWPHLAKFGPFSGQAWKFTLVPQAPGSYRLTTAFRGTGFSLDTFQAGTDPDRVRLSPSRLVSGQAWYIRPVELPDQLLYYKFDRGQGDEVVNYGSAKGTSTMVNAGVGPWQKAGKFGPAMLGSANTLSTHYNYCDTGWNGAMKGDFTAHWWMKERHAPGTGLSYIFGGVGSFRCFTNGVAGAGLWVRGFNSGSTFNIVMPTSGATLQARSRAATGVCVSLVVKGKSAQWYVDGKAHGSARVLPVDGANIAPVGTSTFKIGKHISNASSSAYDLDEFRLFNRAASPAEIELWCENAFAAVGTYGSYAGISLGTTGGAPRVGNSGYKHTVAGPRNMQFLFVVGIKPTPSFDMGIVFPALKGKTWYPSFDIELALATGASGKITLPGGLPNDKNIAGLGFDTQVLGFTGGKTLQSEAVSHKVEFH